MNGKHHFWVAVVTGTIIYILISVIHIGDEFPNPFWAYILGSMIGGAFPDFDMMIAGMRSHRNSITHSGLIQTFITLSYLFADDYSGFIFFLMFFFIGTATHLLIDIIPNKCPKEYETVGSRWGYRIDRIRKNKVSGHIVGPPFRVPSKHERKWLLNNALLLIILTILLYTKLQYGIDLDIPVGW